MVRADRLSQQELHQAFVDSLAGSVVKNGNLAVKPLELDLKTPLPCKVRVYLFNLTNPPGGRGVGEYKIQLIMPGQERGAVGSFDMSDDRVVIISGYHDEMEVFVLWDAHCYPEFAYSRNVQVKAETVCGALGSGISEQVRQIREIGDETVVAAHKSKLKNALALRMKLTLERITTR
jgi:hypothetical protein